ncbi:sirohydrochlorin chelatase [Actinomadura rayongensis]|uniref:Sirohydrochlorin chelatase n=1 Tax=Actinomadura rayongensis TaxID=1429076 RepID=A0A6I4W9E0_9ACTN|nr:sirohydrochlorin chelatase [Actinomadura rayongensis]MXQ66238.1 sirohydrochlorin chelatase [Actinomadura rayongensis]
MVAVAHGSRDPRAAATVADLLDEVRALRPDVPVHGSFLDHAAPAPGRVLAGLADGGARAAVVVPLLLTSAYHSKIDIPGVLARAPHRLRTRQAATLGPDPLVLAALERRLAEVGADDPDIPVVLAVAGSRDPAANASVRALAARWRGRTAVAAFASGTGLRPDAAVAALRASGARRVAVASCFLAPGFFADRVRREAGADVVSPVLGAAPEIAELVVARYAAALAETSARAV